MKVTTSKGWLALLIAAGFVSGVSSTSAAGLSVGFSTIDGGGGNCAGSGFKLSGTIGQPDAGQSAADIYVQQGGFMPAFTKTTLPPLQVAWSGGNLLLTWPDICQGLVVEGAATVDASTWTALGSGAPLAGQRVLAALTAQIPDAVDHATRLMDSERQAFTPMLAILSAQHETQYSRLFRS